MTLLKFIRKIMISIIIFILLDLVSNVYALDYRITDLGAGRAFAMNNNGQIVGFNESFANGGFYENGVWTDLGVISGDYSVPTDINDLGQVSGYSFLGSYNIFIWDKVDGIQDLGFSGRANAINDNGQIVGNIFEDTGDRAFIWDSVSGLTTFGELNSVAYDINNAGKVAGGYYVNSLRDAFIWDTSSGIEYLFSTFFESYAFGINEHNQVVGQVSYSSAGTNAFYWDDTIGRQDIGVLGYKYSIASAINDSGWAVGSSSVDTSSNNHAFIWNSSVGILDLNNFIPADSGWTLISAEDINNSGQIVGYGEFNGETRAFLLTPNIVPEPISSILFVAGGSLLAGRRYMTRKKKA